MGYRVAASLETVPHSVEGDLLVEVAVVALEACH